MILVFQAILSRDRKSLVHNLGREVLGEEYSLVHNLEREVVMNLGYRGE